ncbi:uncharacterized protein LOC105847311 [Hydra vulgaris]|uniref:uncharacterized protein LOC105847311 n=1 Tax=Hydra vulgaris TaxID=6087 RepID=UPI000641509C|nr:uncharacterized protein LOC105847311 [Hydra vulgaris]
MPSDFVRQARSLGELKRWKATEFRSFLIYTGPYVLKNVLKNDLYIHFLCLSIAIRVLDDNNSSSNAIGYASMLLNWFVSKSVDYYGPTFTTYNVYNLIHLSEGVIKFQMTLLDMSLFSFENYLQRLKRLFRGKNMPLAQIVKRLGEIDCLDIKFLRKKRKSKVVPGGKVG